MIDNYNDLPLGTYLDINAVLQSDKEDIDKQVAIIAILAGMDEEDVLRLPLDEYATLSGKTDFLRHDCPAVTAPSRLITATFTLVPTKDFTKVITAQYVDFQTFSKGGVEKLPELLSVLLIPEGKTYNEGYDVADVVAEVRKLSLPVAMALVGFFFASYLESMRATLNSLDLKALRLTGTRRKEVERMVKQTRETLAGLGLPV